MFPLDRRSFVAGKDHSWNSDSLGIARGKWWKARSEGDKRRATLRRSTWCQGMLELVHDPAMSGWAVNLLCDGQESRSKHVEEREAA